MPEFSAVITEVVGDAVRAVSDEIAERFRIPPFADKVDEVLRPLYPDVAASYADWKANGAE